MKKAFKIYERKREYNGKKKVSYEYSINETSGLPLNFCSQHQRKTIQARNKTEATMKILELIKQLEKTLVISESWDSFGHYTSNYMIDAQCHYQN